MLLPAAGLDQLLATKHKAAVSLRRHLAEQQPIDSVG
jgi:hypothetical protein